MNCKSITRCMILCLALLMIVAVLPAQAVQHGLGVNKGCEPCKEPGEKTNCLIQAFFSPSPATDEAGDTWRITDITDKIANTGGPTTTATLPIVSVSGNAACCASNTAYPCIVAPASEALTVPNACGAGQNLSLPGTASPGIVSARSNVYVIDPTDPTPLTDQGQVIANDLCNKGATGCNTNSNLFQPPSSTNVCKQDANLCTVEACDANGQCVSGSPTVCANHCQTCDTVDGVCKTTVTCANHCQTCDSADGVCKTTVTCANHCQTCDSADGVCKTTVTCANHCQTCDSADGVCKTTVTCADKCQSCDSADGVCKQTVVCEAPLPNSCCDSSTGVCTPNLPDHPECATKQAICRTPGFWKEHACGTTGSPLNGPCEGKRGSQNITQKVINACGGCLDVCGMNITNTALMSYDSAIEAMCDSPGKPIFHLTAMALNCCISGFGPDCSGGGDYLSDLFAQANDSCATGGSYRKGEVDCWNNGGIYEDGKCWYGTCEGTDTLCSESTLECNCISLPNNCHSMDLCNEDLDCDSAAGLQPCCFDEGKPAGSARACQAAKSNACSVFGGGCTSGTVGGSCD